MPPELREHLEKSASEKRRSLNAEIVSRLVTTVELEKATLEVSLNPDPEFAPMLLRSLNDSQSDLYQEISELKSELAAYQLKEFDQNDTDSFNEAAARLRELSKRAKEGKAHLEELSAEEKAMIVSWVVSSFLDQKK
ncbi:TPA: Arc family DNA-binding protein [Pseudomonas aeruginosa]|nr:Arc family DNA-binding protein [Pseudomonas aeruginosa]